MTNQPLWIYTTQVTPRLSWICAVLFGEEVVTTTDKTGFQQYSGSRINYSTERIQGVCRIVPHHLLFEKGIFAQEIVCSNWNGLTTFFATPGDIAFDLFAAAFYLVSRYEEWLPHEKDQYGRYAHTNSLAYRESFLNVPLVNLWLKELARGMQEQFATALPQRSKAFRFVPTYDVDIAYAYRGQSPLKNITGFFRDFALGNTEKVMERGNVYAGKKPDPFDVYEWLHTLHTNHSLEARFFLLTIVDRGTLDKNLSAHAKPLVQLYQQLAETNAIGLHPSSQTKDTPALFAKEKARLEKITGRTITHSRQHYLLMQLPETYRLLADLGITDEYSMGYGSVNGFRASFALPYNWYDLERETATSLRIHPFCFMDAAAHFGMGYSANEAGEQLNYFYNMVKGVNGELITIFHNHFLTEQAEWIAWRKMYVVVVGLIAHGIR